MERVDRLGWAAGLSFTSYGLRLGLRVNDPAVLPRLIDRLPPGWRPAPSRNFREIYSFVVGGETKRPGLRRYHMAYQGPNRLSRTHDLDEAIEAFESDLRLYVALWARRRVFIHAGVVEWRGRAIVLPGPSYSGKSSLVSALVQAGATYYSDEYAVLDASGRVHPYPAALRTRTGESRWPRRAPAESLGGGARPLRPLRVGLVAVSQYRDQARWRPRPLTRGQGALALLSNTVPAQLRPKEALQAIGNILSGTRILKGARGEATAMASDLLREAESSRFDEGANA